jgi:hypothetical protein
VPGDTAGISADRRQQLKSDTVPVLDELGDVTAEAMALAVLPGAINADRVNVIMACLRGGYE